MEFDRDVDKTFYIQKRRVTLKREFYMQGGDATGKIYALFSN